MPLPACLAGNLRIPVIGAPMFIVSCPELVIEQCKAGIVGSFPALNARPQKALDTWLTRIREELGAYAEDNPDKKVAPFAVNQIVHKSNDRLMADMEVCIKHEVPIIITSLRPPAEIVRAVHGYGGNDIKLIHRRTNERELINYIKKHGHIMCQKFLHGIKNGDKRVFIINGIVVGAISRVPKKGSFLSNMSKGGVAKIAYLSKNELRISKIVGKNLKKNNIFFAGIDFISGKLNGDINVTSPTGLKTHFELTGNNLAKKFWNELK